MGYFRRPGQPFTKIQEIQKIRLGNKPFLHRRKGMKIYNTKFNLKEERSAMDVAKTFRDWITEKNYMDIPVYENSLNICIHNKQREYRTLFLQEEKVLAGKFSMIEQEAEWITTFTFNDITKTFTVALDKRKGTQAHNSTNILKSPAL